MGHTPDISLDKLHSMISYEHMVRVLFGSGVKCTVALSRWADVLRGHSHERGPSAVCSNDRSHRRVP